MAPAEAPWRRTLRVDPVPMLLRAATPALAYFTRRDLLGERPGPIEALWGGPAVGRILRRQNADGSWTYPGGDTRIRSREDYDQLETFRQVGVLVEQHGLTREHPALARAAACLFSTQAREGDFRGLYGRQHATTYTGAILELLVKAGYGEDPRARRAFRWLLAGRQDDGGWAIPFRTRGLALSGALDVRRWPEPLPPDRTKPSSHLATGMVLRAYAAHPARRRSEEARTAARLLAARLFRRDAYGDRADRSYWDRVSFPFWFTDVVSALDSLSLIGVGAEVPEVRAALAHVRELQRADGTFGFRLMKGKDPELPLWVSLAVCRSVRRVAEVRPGPPRGQK
ncbi:MAG: hypothetical protein QM704_20445 [Anaeromyxobacteraceae bacterium]